MSDWDSGIGSARVLLRRVGISIDPGTKSSAIEGSTSLLSARDGARDGAMTGSILSTVWNCPGANVNDHSTETCRDRGCCYPVAALTLRPGRSPGLAHDSAMGDAGLVSRLFENSGEKSLNKIT